jgi:hypothetical protein
MALDNPTFGFFQCQVHLLANNDGPLVDTKKFFCIKSIANLNSAMTWGAAFECILLDLQ